MICQLFLLSLKIKFDEELQFSLSYYSDKSSMHLVPSALLLLLSGDVETNPGPGRPRPPDPKKVMEEKVTGHGEKIELLEKTVSEQKKTIKEMTEKQVELERALEDQKVELTKCFEDKKVVDTTLNEIKGALNDGFKKQVF